MKVALFGGGMIGQRVAREALARGHTVTAIVRDPARFNANFGDLTDKGLTVAQGDARDAKSVAEAAAGHDAVVSAVGPSGGQPPAMLVETARALLAGLAEAGVRRLIVVNGAGSLEVAPGQQLLDTPQFPAAWQPVARAHRDALEAMRASGADLEWTALSPAALIAPGERTGAYRSGGDQLITDAQGESRISAEDYAVAVVDELETPRHPRQRFTVAY